MRRGESNSYTGARICGPSPGRPVALLSRGAVAVWATLPVVSSVGQLPEFPWPALVGVVAFAGALLAALWLDRGSMAVGR